ncbi:MAG TPA: phosphatase PAP2 family protein [Myxococcales bacterium]|nr:phosphatase PAP2 family protein [Myxococcales bacterium]
MTLTPADALVLPAMGLFLGSTQLFHFAPAHCHWCDGSDDVGTPGSAGAGRGSLNGVDAFFHDALTGAIFSRDTAGTISTVIAYGVVPVGALGAAFFATGPSGSPEAGLRAAVIVVESVAVSGAATQALKLGFARKRPYIRYGSGGTAGYGIDDDESRLGFVSGHTSAVAALGFSAAMCAQLQKSEAAPLLWTAAATLTVLTGTLRVMAEKHYFTDVLAGAVVGAGTGTLIPLLHRRGVQFTGNGLAYNF